MSKIYSSRCNPELHPDVQSGYFILYNQMQLIYIRENTQYQNALEDENAPELSTPHETRRHTNTLDSPGVRCANSPHSCSKFSSCVVNTCRISRA